MEEPKIYKVYCEYYVKADNLDAVEKYVSEEVGDYDFYERHILIDEIGEYDMLNQDVDVDLTKD